MELTVQKGNILYYSLIVVVLGVPVWWNTTNTYRASLPTTEVSQLKVDQTLFSIPVSLCGVIDEKYKLTLTETVRRLIPKTGRVQYDVHFIQREACEGLYVVEFSKDVTQAEILSLGRLRLNPSLPDTAQQIYSFLGIELLHKHTHSVDDPSLHLKYQDVRNAMAVATSYNVLVTVVNPDPGTIQLDLDLEEGTRRYLQPFLAKLEGVVKFTFQTQVLRYIPLSMKPLKNGDHFYISENNLPHLINPIESKLGTSTTNDINLIIYLVEPRLCPLKIKLANGDYAAVSSFLSPQFGAIMLYDTVNKTAIDHGETFSTLLPQLKQLLGLSASSTSTLSHQDLFLISARQTLVNILQSVDTLNSLISLVDSIPNMVIGDHIKDLVLESVAGISSARAVLAQTRIALTKDKLAKAIESSTTARDSAETGFSDPSILALLYFPDDQKFAIYIPLFLPVGLPLVIAYFDLIKEWRTKRLAA